MFFRRPTTDYGIAPVAETPFQKAGQIWDERIGSARVQAANWRYMAFGCLALAFAAIGGLIFLALQSRVTPYVVEVDKLGGIQAVAPAISSYTPTDAQIAHHLANLIINVRSLSIDPVVVRRNWLRAYEFTTDKGAMALNEYARENDPFAKVGRRSRTVNVTSVVRVSEESFQVRWNEKTFENGAVMDTERYTGLLTVVISPPNDAETLRKNPLGVFVHSVNWGQDLDTGGEK